MGVYQYRDLKKPSGGLRSLPHKRKRRYAMGDYFVPTVLGDSRDVRVKRVMGGNYKLSLRTVTEAIVNDPKTGKSVKAKILAVVSTPANREYARRNIITKGTIIRTSAGLARVTSRPGQDGIVNAILVEGQQAS
ncbi:30S ribosomal protein S8e [Acidilobus saccharovorans 345-15]|uniref:Small ribosomal subunit protein eS8 n=1 Tax=Acidilobus saccharovorans (strain DSM 16705 / JCM 18335 / VKM B-2471 / 345-15) TaxID=666510 RepID=D9Q2Y5_ACIS3|nr:30S ribosomal protein S8e [Acidilobus saccharovorans]ADL19673.1 30S ribosomal protein S8e [Acidilobus saccharovorans 345-15]